MIDRGAEDDATASAGLMGDRGNAGLDGDLGGVLAALEERADLTDHLRELEAADAREGRTVPRRDARRAQWRSFLFRSFMVASNARRCAT